MDLNNTLYLYFSLFIYYIISYKCKSHNPSYTRTSTVHMDINEPTQRTPENKTEENADCMGHFVSLK